MGVWGTGIFDNDWAADIKEDYSEALKYSVDDEDALNRFLDEHRDSIEDPQDGPLTWMVLAKSMWTKGRLTEYVYSKAVQAAKDDLENWKEGSERDYEQRRKNLDRFIEALSKPQPPIKAVKRVEPFKCTWKRGDAFLWKNSGVIRMIKNRGDKKFYCRKGGGLIVIFDSEILHCGMKCVKLFLKFTGDPHVSEEELRQLPYIRFADWVKEGEDTDDYRKAEFSGRTWYPHSDGRMCDDFYSFATVIKGMDLVKKLKYIGSVREDELPSGYDDRIMYHAYEQFYEKAVDWYACTKGYYEGRQISEKYLSGNEIWVDEF